MYDKDHQGNVVGKLKRCTGKKLDYLGMTLDYSIPGEVTFCMDRYTKDMVEMFECHARSSHEYGWNLLRPTLKAVNLANTVKAGLTAVGPEADVLGAGDGKPIPYQTACGGGMLRCAG